jgi:hypothetical protein
VCVRAAGAGRRKRAGTVTAWGSVTSQVLALRDHLIGQRVTCAVMEAAGDCWKPFCYLLEDAGFEVLLVSARHVKNPPGPQERRRGRGLAGPARRPRSGAGSFVPPGPVSSASVMGPG